MLPTYGTNMGVALFENDNNFTKAATQAIKTAIANWIPDVSIDSIVIGTINPVTSEADITITLVTPDNLLTSISTTTAILNYDGTVTRP
jgi:predicted Zn-dependent protease